MPRRRRQPPPVPAVNNTTAQDQAIVDSGNTEVVTTTTTDVGGDFNNTVTTTGITGDQLADILANLRPNAPESSARGNPFTDALMTNLMEHSDVNAAVAADKATATAPSRLLTWALWGVGLLVVLFVVRQLMGGSK